MEVKFFAAYRDVTGSRSETLPAQTDVLALLRLVAERWPDLSAQLLTPDGGDLGKDAIVMVNGRHITHLQGVTTPLTEQDVVALFPVVAGG